MRRKVMLHGPSTLTISLPSKWVKKYGIKKGNEIEVTEKGPQLHVSTPEHLAISEKTIEINASQLEILSSVFLLQLYQRGFEEVKITFQNPQELLRIKRTLTELISYEIVEQGTHFCLVKNVAETTDKAFPSFIRRLFLLVKGVLHDSYTLLLKNDWENLKSLPERDLEINKISNFCIRQLFLNEALPQKYVYLTLVNNLERVGDEYKNMMKFITEKRSKFSKKIINLFKEVADFFDLCYAFHYSPSLNQAISIARKYDGLRKQIDMHQKVTPDEMRILFGLRTVLVLLIPIQGSQLVEVLERNNGSTTKS